MMVQVDTSKLHARKGVIENHIKENKNLLQKLEGINSWEDFEKLRETTEKCISYDAARLEELDHLLLNLVETVEIPVEKPTIELSDAPKTTTVGTIDAGSNADFEPVRYEDGGLALTATVRKRISMLSKGQTFKPIEITKFLMDRNLVELAQRSDIAKVIRASGNVKKISMGLYQRVA